jgi:hypothetical protein
MRIEISIAYRWAPILVEHPDAKYGFRKVSVVERKPPACNFE